MSRIRLSRPVVLGLLAGICAGLGGAPDVRAAAQAAPSTSAQSAPTTPARPAQSAPATPAKPPAKPATTSTAPKSKAPPAKPGTAAAARKTPVRVKQKPGEVLEVDWKELLPVGERAHYSAAAPPPVHGPLGEGGPPAVQKQNTNVNEELGDINVHIPGFVVPIGVPRNGLIREFFLVPYIGACIHVPPPPPNQMVYVTSASGIAADAIHEAYWVTGKMRLESRTTALGNSAYALNASKVELYQY